MHEFTCVHDREYSECEECWIAKVDREAYEQDELWQREDNLSYEDTRYSWDTLDDISELHEAEVSLRDMYRVLSDEVSGEFYGWEYN